EELDSSLRGPARRRHLPLRLLEVHDARPGLGIDRVRNDEGVAKPGVEPLGAVTRELEMLALVVPDRNVRRPVEKDVAGHEHRVREEPGRDRLLTLALVLELRHPPQLT